MRLRVVIAPDSFKGSLDARAVATAIADGWAQSRPDDTLVLLPQADGGEGTLDAIEAAVAGAIRHDCGLVAGPDLRPTPGQWLELPGKLGVVELAQMSGLPLMERPDALGATTRGLGEVIRAALNSGMRSLLIGLGGSASTDGGAGALVALGLRLTDASGRDIAPGGGGLGDLALIEQSLLVPPPPGGVTLLTDVAAPLLGPAGAAAVFGPQKGASTEDTLRLEAGLARLAERLGGAPQQPGAGAAGGVGYGFAAAWGAVIRPGAAYLSQLSGLPAALAAADVVITGEGRFDATSSGGKVVGDLIARAAGTRARVGIIAGRVAADTGDAFSCALIDLASSPEQAMTDPEPLLRAAGRAAARHFGR